MILSEFIVCFEQIPSTVQIKLGIKCTRDISVSTAMIYNQSFTHIVPLFLQMYPVLNSQGQGIYILHTASHL